MCDLNKNSNFNQINHKNKSFNSFNTTYDMLNHYFQKRIKKVLSLKQHKI